jgi:hypothetical protein
MDDESGTDWVRLGESQDRRAEAMPAPHKGERERVVSRVPKRVFDELERRRVEAGVSSLSQYVADLLSATTGHADLVMELDQEVMSLTA